MKNYWLILILLLISRTENFAQTKEINREFFDAEWRPVKFEKDSKYYRTIESIGQKFLVKDFYTISNQLQMEAQCKAIKPDLVFDGLAKFYNEDGNPSQLLLYKDKDIKYLQYWSNSGDELLIGGSGTIKETNESGNQMIMIVKDSSIVVSYEIRPNKADTIYSTTQTSADFPGGLVAFYKNISANVKYPKEARRNGIQGKVFVEFLVNKTGEIEEVKTIKGIGSGCDEEAENSIRSVGKKWIAAQYNNKPVKSIMVLPVYFKLGK